MQLKAAEFKQKFKAWVSMQDHEEAKIKGLYATVRSFIFIEYPQIKTTELPELSQLVKNDFTNFLKTKK